MDNRKGDFGRPKSGEPEAWESDVRRRKATTAELEPSNFDGANRHQPNCVQLLIEGTLHAADIPTLVEPAGFGCPWLGF